MSPDTTVQSASSERLAKQARWEFISIYHSGDQFFDALGRAIDQAQRTIDIEMYIFAVDRLGSAY